MAKNVIKKWVKALRSGEYEQGKHRLRAENKFCCLGVLCDLYAKENPKKAVWKYDTFYVQHDARGGFPPTEVSEWVGNDVDCYALAQMNDDGNSFETIATEIENQVRKKKNG